MNQNKPLDYRGFMPFEAGISNEPSEWSLCDLRETGGIRVGFFGEKASIKNTSRIHTDYSENWAESVPSLVTKIVALLTEKKKQELRFNLLQITIDGFERRLHKLECAQTKIIPIDTFAPEPYKVLRTILISVNSVEGGFNAGWYDANIHSSGDNEEESVSNLKSLILDFFNIFSNETAESLGPEPMRQLAVMKQYIQEGV